MQFKNKILPLTFLLIILLFGLSISVLVQNDSVRASLVGDNPTPIGPNRYTTMTVDFTLYEWWIADWGTNSVQCAFWVDHEGLPNDNDIGSACGRDFYEKQWLIHSAPCSEEEIKACAGYYLIKLGSKPSTKDVPVILPPPVVWISVEGCEPDPDGWCTKQPYLLLTGEEPLPNESITTIYGTVGSDTFTCSQNPCKFELKETDPQGIRLEFWADSTYGDSSDRFFATLRVIAETDANLLLAPRLYVDVLSTQWVGEPAASCAQAWESFPPSEGVPDWLTTPLVSDDLKSSIPYAYLAANLISQGVVDTALCPNDGLTSDGSAANGCGMEAAKPAVEQWQNQFDVLIFQVAQESQVPAQLLKNLFSRESQFWPGVFKNSKDIGLGQLTENGADTALLWNPSFYNQFCPLILNKEKCENKGYANLQPRERAILRGALVHSVDASCNDCPLGLDISRANFSIKIFAHTLLANCEQAGKILQNVSGQAPGQTTSYEDLWKLTLVNYNAGPGCLSDAVTKSNINEKGSEHPFDWPSIAAEFDQVCKRSVDYVEDISKASSLLDPTPTPTPTSPPTADPNATLDPNLPTETPTPEPVDPNITATPDSDGE